MSMFMIVLPLIPLAACVAIDRVILKVKGV